MQSYKCEHCGECFVRGCGLASHLRKHETDRLECTGCHFVADDKTTLEQHRQTCEFIDRTAAPSTPVSRRKTPKKENQPVTPKPETPKPPEQDPDSSKRSRKKVNLSPPTAIFTKTVTKTPKEALPIIHQEVNENSAPPSSRKVSFVLPKPESKVKTAHLPILSTPKPPKPVNVKSPRAPFSTGPNQKKEDNEPPGNCVKESDDLYFPLPPGSKWAPPGGDPGFPARVEVDLKTPLMEQSKNLLVPSWLVFVENPVNNFVRPEPVKPEKDPLKPPKLEDFYKIPGCYGQERHPIEAIDFYERALERYNREMKARKFAQREGPSPYLRARKYLKRKAEIEDLTKFRAHRDRHELGGLFKCSECNYGSHSPLVTNNHMFFDHYLSDVKVLEGLPSSDSEEEEFVERPHGQEFVPRPVSQKKKSRKRRRNW